MQKTWIVSMIIVWSLFLWGCSTDTQLNPVQEQNSTWQVQITTWETQIATWEIQKVWFDISAIISSGDSIWVKDSVVINKSAVNTWDLSKTYRSDDLGFEFNITAYSPNRTYNNNKDNDYLYFVRSGNKLSIIGSRFWIDSAQLIERITKKTTEKISQAIKRIFLSKSNKKCVVHSISSTEWNVGYSWFTIWYTWVLKEGEYIVNICSDHAQTDGIQFFLWQNNSDHFYFIMAGQDPDQSADWLTAWYNTIKLF